MTYREGEAQCLPPSRHLRVRRANGATLSLTVGVIPELRAATRAQLSDGEIVPGGDGLHWEALDFTVSVPELGRLGGARSTLAKASAARRKGLRGGRPRVV